MKYNKSKTFLVIFLFTLILILPFSSALNLITDSSGNKIEVTNYGPFGDILDGGDSRYNYNSKEKDLQSGLNYYGARYYEADTLKHFTQPDTVIQDVYNPQSLNRYSYVLNNPYKYVDPTGNEPITYAFIETGIDVISIIVSSYTVHKDPESVVNQIAFSLDVIDLLSGPFSNPAPSGLTILAINKAAGELGEEAVFNYLRDLEEKNPEAFEKIGKYTTEPINDLLKRSAELNQQSQISSNQVSQQGESESNGDSSNYRSGNRYVVRRADGSYVVRTNVGRGIVDSPIPNQNENNQNNKGDEKDD